MSGLPGTQHEAVLGLKLDESSCSPWVFAGQLLLNLSASLCPQDSHEKIVMWILVDEVGCVSL